MVLALACPAVSSAQDQAPTPPPQHAETSPLKPAEPIVDRVVFNSGDVLTGHVTKQTADAVTLRHATLGEVVIPRGAIKEVTLGVKASKAETTDAATNTPATPAAAAPKTKPAAAKVQESDAPKPTSAPTTGKDATAPKPIPPAKSDVKWTGHIDLGANGAKGNSDTTNFHTAFGFKRAAERSTLTLEANYRAATSNGKTTTNRFFDEINFNRLKKKDGRWSYFARTTQELNEFKDYNVRVTGSGGASYEIIKNEKTKLQGYSSLGAAREFGGSDLSVMPFSLFGVSYSHKFNDRISLTASSEIEPRLDSIGEYRARAKSALDLKLNDSGSLKLRFSLEDEYDSDSNKSKKNDFYYTAAIVYSF